MNKTKLFTAVIVANVIGFLFLFWYVSDLKSYLKEAAVAGSTAPSGVATSPSEANIVAPIATDSTLVAAPNIGKTLDVFYEGALVRMQVLGKVSENDADYVTALEQLSSGSNKSAAVAPVITAEMEMAKIGGSKAKKSVDHFNKIILKEAGHSRVAGGKLNFTEQIQQLVTKATAEKDAVSDAEKDAAADAKSYIQALYKESDERKNESRVIKVRRGDSLSRIAARAYGSGLEANYLRIFKANPHLTDPNMITEGEFLRVPL